MDLNIHIAKQPLIHNLAIVSVVFVLFLNNKSRQRFVVVQQCFILENKVMREGSHGYLEKPFDDQLLLNIIKTALDKEPN